MVRRDGEDGELSRLRRNSGVFGVLDSERNNVVRCRKAKMEQEQEQEGAGRRAGGHVLKSWLSLGLLCLLALPLAY